MAAGPSRRHCRSVPGTPGAARCKGDGGVSRQQLSWLSVPRVSYSYRQAVYCKNQTDESRRATTLHCHAVGRRRQLSLKWLPRSPRLMSCAAIQPPNSPPTNRLVRETAVSSKPARACLTASS